MIMLTGVYQPLFLTQIPVSADGEARKRKDSHSHNHLPLFKISSIAWIATICVHVHTSQLLKSGITTTTTYVHALLAIVRENHFQNSSAHLCFSASSVFYWIAIVLFFSFSLVGSLRLSNPFSYVASLLSVSTA
jgi:hypothetical protein